MKSGLAILASILFFSLGLASGAESNKTPKTPNELAIEDQNPIARVLRVQIEDNVQFGFGPGNGT